MSPELSATPLPAVHSCQRLHLFLKEGKACICSRRLFPLLLPGAQWLEAVLEVLFLLVQTLCPALHVFSNLKCRVVCSGSSPHPCQSPVTEIPSTVQVNPLPFIFKPQDTGCSAAVSLYTVFKDTAVRLSCMNPPYQSNPLSDGSVILPLVLAWFHLRSSYAELISALKPCQLPLSSTLHCKLQARTEDFLCHGKGELLSHSSEDFSQLPSHFVFYLLSCFTLRLLFLLLHFFGGGCGSCLLVRDTFRSRHVGLLLAIPVKVLLG